MNIGTVYNWYQCCLGRRENVSSIVRYKNKKTGFVSVYESISRYDPVTKQSRPIRKYLGLEDPETGELIPSSGKRGRKRLSETGAAVPPRGGRNTSRPACGQEPPETAGTDARIRELEEKNRLLTSCLENMRDLIADALAAPGGASPAEK